ncbi:homeodomain-like protein [Artemisia annua]|uniref:Homeodomain-like protein n=1 Tax=Artemisia annua TaxID=35608 RepID=A0A2U1KVX5_ARTAN|nr:homeodomain-like protein [Artemisia annua]
MDPDISGWILEFLLRQNTLDDETLNNLIHILPIPNTNPRLKKSLILRKIESDIKTGTIADHIIDYLESIIELDITENVYKPSEALKEAYRTIAMYCTIKSIEKNDKNEQSVENENENFANELKRVWSERVREMEECDNVRDEMLSWVKELEARIMKVDVCEIVLAMFKELDVVEVLSKYVNEAREMMGPSFIEVACETVLGDRELSKELGLDGGLLGRDVDVADVHSEGNEASRARVLPKNKQISHISHGRLGTHRGAKIVDPMETSHDQCNGIPTPEVDRVKEALEKSSSELHAVVKDPLPEALRYAESLNVNTSGENMARDHDVGASTRNNDEVPSSSHDRKGKALEADGGEGLRGDQNERRKPSLMERNSTAHTVEWSDSIDTSDEGSPTRPHLNTPKKRTVSPLSIYNINKLAKQRKKRRWTVVEEDALRTGVHKYGKGNWKLILSMYRDIFEDRTEVDLKDKWRNLTR